MPSPLGIVLLIVLVIVLFGALPVWPHAAAWGPWPSGIAGIVLLILIVLLLAGRL